jgi:hypothetical protein
VILWTMSSTGRCALSPGPTKIFFLPCVATVCFLPYRLRNEGIVS